MSTGWLVGYTIGGLIVVVVVVLLLLMIRGAHRATLKVKSIVAALEEARDNTEVLWAVNDVTKTVRRITGSAGTIRTHLAQKHLGVAEEKS
ncbi:MAG: hypothetical protein ACYC06_08365 [Ilumatobacteraceae bacterium]